MQDQTQDFSSIALRYAALSAEKRAEFRQKLAARAISAAQLPIVPIQARPAILPLSHGQEQLWFLWKLEPESSAYHVLGAVRLSGALEVPALRAALGAIAQRHEALRTTFREHDGLPRQHVAELASVALREHQAAEPRAIAALLRACAQQPFDLTAGPLLRADLVREGEREHVLLLSAHHIVCDEWSLGILLKELVASYAALRLGQQEALPKVALGYGDVSLWQREWFDAESLAGQLAYWKRTLGSEHPIVGLPFDREDTPARGGAGKVTLTLPVELSAELRAAAQRRQATPFMVLFANWAALLSRLSGERDVRIGVPVAGRARRETHDVVGFFVNTLVLCAQIGRATSFESLLATVRTRVIEGQANQELPLSRLVDALAAEQAGALRKLFDVSFNFQEDQTDVLRELPGLTVAPFALDEGKGGDASSARAAKFDLSLNVTEERQSFTLSFDYAAQRYDRETIALLAAQYEAQLRHLLQFPDAPVLRAPLAAPVNVGLTLPAKPSSIVEQVHAHAKTRGGQTALVDARGTQTWAELWAASGRLAAVLRAHGVGSEHRVALCLERSNALVVAIVAVMRAGAAYVPLDIAAPAERLAFQLLDSGARVVLAERALAWLPEQVVLLDPQKVGASAGEALLASLQPTQAAYVLYTSGTTGRPKGVVVSHEALACYAQALVARLPEQIENAAYVSTPAADLGHTTLFGALYAGFTLHLIDDASALDPDRFAALMAARRIDLLKIVPTHLVALLQATRAVDVLPRRCLVLGGEPLSAELARRIAALRPECSLINHYGPTETTVGVLTLDVPADTRRRTVALGRALGAASLNIVDAEGELAAHGGVGEIVIGGPTVARGYLGRPGFTAERFVPDPQGAPGSRRYRSGDRGRINTVGLVEFLGRVDDQLKIRGYRVEPGELTAQLRELPGVRDAAVIARKDRHGRDALCAYVVGDALDVQRLESALARRVPSYMLPSSITLLAALPRTANGKLDRRALPEPAREESTARVAPRTPAEQALFEVWASVLGRSDFGVTDDFFQLGGESILALQVVARAARAGLFVNAKELFAEPRIDRLAALARTGEQERASITLAELSGPLPLTPIQARFFELYPEAPAHYNQSLLLCVRDQLDQAALTLAFAKLVARHDALRLHLEPGTVPPALSVAPKVPHASTLVESIDLRALPSEQRVARLEQEGERLQQSHDLGAGLLLRAGYFVLADDDARLLITVHHLAIDGVSWRILLDELELLYEAALAGAEAALPSVTTPWSVWASALMQQAGAASLARDLDYYRKTLEEARAALRPLPLQRAADAQHVDHSRQALRELLRRWDPVATRAMQEDAAGGYGLRLDELITVALAHALAAWSASSGALIELEGHGRESAIAGSDALDVSRTLGWFTTRYPVYLSCAPGNLAETLVRAKEALRTVPEKGATFGLLAYGPQRAELAELPRPEVSFNYLGRLELGDETGSTRFRLASESGGDSLAASLHVSHPLELVAAIREGSLELSIRYLSSVFDDEAIAALARDLDAQLTRFLAHTRATPARATASDFPLTRISQDELNALQVAPAELEDIYPATAIQSGLIFHGLVATGDGVYINQRRVTLDLGENPARARDALRSAWQRAVQRHPILRTHFEATARGAMLQVVHRAVELPYREHDLSGESDYERELAELRAADLAQGFDLAQAPLLRVQLVARPDGRHDLLWTNHHALLDGWSTARVLAEVARDYRALLVGELSGPGDAPAPFRDFVAWYLTQPSGEAFWRAELSALATPARLLEALPRPRTVTAGAQRMLRSLTGARAARVQEAARAEGVTLATLSQAAWALVLARYAGRRQVIFGVTVAGRPAELPGSAEMLGPFLNSLPFVVDADPRASARAWLGGLQQRAARIRQYEHTPLHRIQQWAGSAGEGLFDSLLVFENYPVDVELTRGALASTHVDALERTHYPLCLAVTPNDAELTIEWAWDGSKLSEEQVEQLARHYLEALEALALAGERPLSALALSAPEAIHQSARPRQLRSVLERVREHACVRPDAVAVIARDGELSYARLMTCVTQLAARLAAVPSTLDSEEVIGLAVARSSALAVGTLGIWAAGAAYVPLDREYPSERLVAMLRTAGVRRVVIDRASHAALARSLKGIELVWLDADESPQDAPLPLARPPHADQLAYVMFTSGSTGEPKGVAVSHGAVAAHCDDCEAFLQLTPSDRVHQFSTISFDASVEQLFGALAAGATVVVRGEEVPDAETFCAELERYAVSVVDLPTAYWQRALVRSDVLARFAALPALRVVSVGGETLSSAALTRFRRFAPERPWLVNTYGPTETTASCTMHVTCADDEDRAHTVIGRALPSRSACVLDESANVVPLLGVGELCVGGVTLARGYQGRPAETALRFAPSPFARGERVYRTGDLVRRLPGDRFEFIGRRDAQVKLRGFRVELGEIEQALAGCDGVRAAAVAIAGEGETARLIGYVAGELEEAEILRALGQKLPRFMVPARVLVLPDLPLLPNGKLDRKALPLSIARTQVHVEPVDAREETLLRIWREVLERADFGTKDDFFTLGGDSILSLQIVARARAEGLRLSPKQVFDHPTVGALARAVTELAPASEMASLDAQPGQLPLTPIQRLFFSQYPEGESHYNQALLVRSAQLAEPALSRALTALVTRHEALRLRFTRDQAGTWGARIAPATADSDVALEILDLRGKDWPERLRAQAERVQRALDIEDGPLIRAAYFRVGDDAGEHVAPEGRLLLVAHHLAVDGVSWRILLSEFSALYRAYAQGVARPLPGVTPWSAWAHAASRYADSDAVRADAPFWRALSAGVDAHVIATPPAPRSSERVEELSLALDAEFTARLLAAAPKAYRLRVDELLLAAWLDALRAQDPARGFLIDLEGHGRAEIDTELDLSGSVGWFTTQYPIWFAAESLPPDAHGLLLRVKELSRAASPQRGFHFGLLQANADPALREAVAPLPRAPLAFNYLGRVEGSSGKEHGALGFALAEESIGASAAAGAYTHALELSALVREGRLRVVFRCDPDKVDAPWAEGMRARFDAALRRLVDHAERAPRMATPADFPLLTLTQAELDGLAVSDAVDLYPATPAQQGLVFHALREGDEDHGVYVDQFRFTIRGELDVPALRAAWQAVLARHDVLRTRFILTSSGQVLQAVEPEVSLPFRLDDTARALGSEGYERELARQREQDLRAGVQLDRAPLLRVTLYRRPDGQHDLIWTNHHALLDGWSTSRLLGEVLALYRASRAGESLRLERPAPYRDYVRWLAGRPSAETFWQGVLAEVDEAAGLLQSLPRPDAPQRESEKLRQELTPSLDAQLKARAQSWQVTQSTLLQAAWAIVIAQHVNQEQVAYGLTVSGRPPELPGVESMLGLFINSLPVFSRVRASDTVFDYLRALQAYGLALREHEHTPLAELAKWAKKPASELFDTLFVFENYPVHQALRAGGPAALDVVRLEKVDRTHYPLTLTVHAEPRLEVEWEWDAARLGRESAQALASAYLRVLTQLARADGDTRLGQLSAAPELTPQPLAHHPYRSVSARVAARCARAARDVALWCEGATTTYQELERDAASVAHALRQAGVQHDGLVGVCLARSAALVSALLGVWRAGAGYVPLDPSYPAARLADMLTDVEVVLCDAHSAALHADLFATRRALRIDEIAPAQAPGSVVEPHPEQLAYVIYTSGSTGKPKGVAITHGALSAHVDDFLATYRLAADDRVLFSSTINFDVSLHELFPALIVGGRVVMRGDDPWSLDTLTAVLREQELTFSRVATAYWQTWTQRLMPQDAFPALRQVTVGGEGLAGDALARWQASPLAAIGLDNLYGPTETTVAALRHRTGPSDAGAAIVPIGQRFESRSARVIDAAGRAVPCGGVGELCIGGPTVARGYLAEPALTAERFVPDPEHPGQRVYRSGDLCRERGDGTVEFLGRGDAQVKLRGYRIELSEIELALRSYPGVESAVAALKGEGEQKRLIGYVVGEAERDGLMAFLGARLPAWMVPSAFVSLAALPVLPNGKVDRRALPEPELAARELIAPRSDVERTLWQIWRAVLKRDELSIADNFFELGGDSILSLQILARARESGLKLTPKQIFAYPTIEGAARVARRVGSRERQEVVPGELPLTPIQARFFERYPHGPAHWNQSLLLASQRALDGAALARALDALYARHDALRARFVPDPARPFAWRQDLPEHATQGVVLETIDLRHTSELEARIAREGERVQRSLDLSLGPLLRAAHFLLPNDEARLLLVAHHLVVDGVSWRILLEELEEAYAQSLRGEAISLPVPATPWSAFCRALSDYATKDAVRGELALWLAQLKGARTLPVGSAFKEADAETNGKFSWELDADTTRQLLEAAPRSYRMRPDEVLLAALSEVLATWSAQPGALIDLEGHGREDLLGELELGRTVGWFTTRYPVWLSLPAGTSDAHDALVRVKEQLRAVPHKGFHWGLLRYAEDGALRAQLAALPQAQVSFNYLGQFDQALDQAGPFRFARETAGRDTDPALASAYALNINALIEAGTLSVTFNYRRDLLDQARVSALVEAFAARLRLLVAHCAVAPRVATASDFPLARITQAELGKLALPLGEVQDIYPATPLQQGFLFHSLYAQGHEESTSASETVGDGVYVYQLRLTLVGALDVAALGRAWQAVLSRHDILRTHFAWRHGGAALQVVRQQVALPYRHQDWSRAEDYEQRMASFLRDDVGRGFALDRAPLMRVAVFARPDGKHDVVWTMHHTLADGWSSARLVDEVIEAYRHGAQGERASQPRTVPFRNYVAWLSEQPSSEDFWRGLLAEQAEPALLMPASGKARAPEPGTHHRYDSVAPDLSQRLSGRARELGVTLSTLTQAAWGLVLARFANAERAAFGVTVSGRPPELPGAMDMIGLFINALPVFVEAGPRLGLGDFLRAHQGRADALRAVEHTPLGDVQRWAGVSGEALFDTLFVYENFPVSVEARSADFGLRIERSERADRTHYPLTLTLTAEPTLALEWEWDGARLERTLVEQLGASFLRALEELAERPLDTALGALRTAAKSEPQPLAGHAYQSVPERVIARAREAGERSALWCEGAELSYQELDSWSTRIAHQLHRAGASDDGLIGVSVTRSPGMVAALLGVWKAGSAYVPLDPSYPAARLSEMLQGIEVVLCDAQTAHVHETLLSAHRVLRIDQLDDAPSTGSFRSPHPEQLAYVIYTSGSTGRPKGVAITHGALSAHVDDFMSTYGLSAEDRVLFSSTINFDVSLHELFPALIAGGRVIMRGDEPWSLETLTSVLREQKLSFARVATAYWQAWAKRLAPGDAFPALRQVTVGGEGLAGDALARWHAGPLSEIALDNLYGPTETTVAALRHRTNADDAGEAIVPIGHPFASRSARVIGRSGELVMQGGVGELCIGGPTVARGYLAQPALTAERFVPDPERPGQRLYRSGDLCRARSDGTIEFLGRADAQVKLRGYRIELGEVELALRSYAGVESAVAEVKGQGELRRLVGYVTGELDPSGLKAWLSSKLPAWMVPSAFVRLPALPLLPNGKVDRRSLPEPELEARELTAPRTELERTLWEIWRAVLKRDEISVTDNFFELGGDSILSLQILARAREAGFKLTPKQVFEHPTIEASARVARALASRRRHEVVTGEIPLTPIQARFFERHPHGPAHFNQSVLLRVDTAVRPLDLAALTRVLASLVERHDALRLRFTRDEHGAFHACVTDVASASAQLAIETIDLRAERSFEAALEREGNRIQQSLNLGQGLLLRAAHFALPGDQARVLLVVHHLAVDGVSWRILLEEIETGYAQAESGEPIALPSASTPWSAWAVALSRYARDAEAEARLSYWESAFDQAAPAPSFDEGDRRGGVSQAVRWELSRADTEQLVSAAPRAYRTRVDELLLTALSRTLSDWAEQPGVLIDLEGHGREDVTGDDDIDVSRTLGWFTTRYPVWLAPSDIEADPGRALIGVKESLRAVPDKGIDFGLLRYAAHDALRQRAAALPSAWVSFNYLGSFDEALSPSGRFGFAGEPSGDATSPDSELAYALELNGMIVEGALSLSFRYSPGVLSTETVEAWVRSFDANVRRLIAHAANATPVATASDFPLSGLSQEALDRLALPLSGARAIIQDIYPATPIQQGLIFQSLLQADRGAYISQLCLTLRGELDYAAMRAAWVEAVARHDILRTQFEWRHGGEALQIVRREVELPLVVHDWSDAADYAARLDAFRAKDLATGFDLSRAPLFRLHLIRRPDGGHDLVRTNHHALSDGWSSEQLFAEILENYAAERLGVASPLPPPPSYRNYIDWLATRPSPRPFWERTLARLDDPATVLLALRAEAHDESRASQATEPFEQTLSTELSVRLRTFAQTRQITLNTLVQAAWALVLARLADRTQAIFGATVSGRPPELPDADRILGPFINTLPVFIETPPALSIGEWLAALQREATERRDYEYTPLRDLQHWVKSGGNVPATMGGDVLFDSLLVFENYPTDDELLSRDVGLVMEQSDLVDRTHYPLALTIVPEDEAIKLEWEWDEARVARCAVDRIARHYIDLLDQLASESTERPLAALVLRPAAPYSQPRYEPFRPLLHRFAQHAARTPERVAVVCGAEALTYGALDALARQVAAQLSRLGIQREEPVGVALGRAARLPAALLGALYAGASYVPLDPSYPSARLAAMRERAAIRIVIGDRESAALKPELFRDVQCVDLDALDAPTPSYAPRDVHPEQLAYILYTSGSSGEPKGVGITQRALALHLDDYLGTHALSERDVVYQFSTINFDVAVEQLFPALAVGARVIMRGASVPALEAFHAELAAQRVSVVDLPTSYWQEWTELSCTTGLSALPALRLVSVGGEVLPPGALARWQESPFAALRLENSYGPTEATVTACYHITTALDARSADVPIGVSYPGRSAYVVDAGGELASEDAVGELTLGGASLARGYLGRAKETAERFVPDPWGQPGSRMYRTGDRAFARADGRLSFVGRRDTQVKIRGFRVELAEIEDALMRTPGVRAAAVALTSAPDLPSARQLIAAVVGDVPVAELSTSLARRLPAHMIPTSITLVAALPRTANGKIDRTALAHLRSTSSHPARAPKTPLEAQLQGIYRKVLARADLGLDEDLLSAGADSLSALRVLSAAKQIGVALSLEAIFGARSVEALAAALERGQSAPGSSVIALNQGTAARRLFCVHPLYGTVGAYLPLASALGDAVAVFGLRAPGFTEPDFHPDSLAELAREYVRRLRLIAPEGPYHLLGWSLGGWIAAQMARELEAQGETVALLAIVDTRAEIPSTRVERAELARTLQADASAEDAALSQEPLLRERLLDVLELHESLLASHRIEPVRAPIRAFTAARAHAAHEGSSSGSSWSPFGGALSSELAIDAGHEEIIAHPTLFAELRRLLEEMEP